MPAWRLKLMEEKVAASAVHNTILTAAANKEQQARERLAKLKARAQRELTRAASLSALEDTRARKRKTVVAMREQADRLIGRDINSVVASIEMPSEEQIVSFSKLLNEQLNKHFDPDARNFFSLFKFMDIDGSRRISFPELETLVRQMLKVREKQINHQQLLALWKVLDADLSGFIDAGELSRFLRIGQSKSLTPAQLARKKLQEARLAEKEVVRAESNKRLEKHMAARLTKVVKADPDDLRRFGEFFAKSAKGLNVKNFYALFKTMDGDQSGLVNWEEARAPPACVRMPPKCMPFSPVTSA